MLMRPGRIATSASVVAPASRLGRRVGGEPDASGGDPDAAGELPPLSPLTKYIDVRASHGCRQAQGGVIVTRGRGWLARLAGGLAGFPPAGEMPLRLTVTGDEVWTRQFGTHRFTTRLSARDGLLCERSGIVTMAMALRPKGLALHRLPRRCWLFGWRLPLVAGLRVTAVGSGRDWHHHFDVALWHWLTGPIIGYRGSLTPEPAGGHVPAHPAAGYPPPAPS